MRSGSGDGAGRTTAGRETRPEPQAGRQEDCRASAQGPPTSAPGPRGCTPTLVQAPCTSPPGPITAPRSPGQQAPPDLALRLRHAVPVARGGRGSGGP